MRYFFYGTIGAVLLVGLIIIDQQMDEILEYQYQVEIQRSIILTQMQINRLHIEHHDQDMYFTRTYGIPLPYLHTLRAVSLEYDLDVEFMTGLMAVESRYNPNAISHRGAVGLMQVLPSTAQDIDTTLTRQDLFEPDTNIEIGCIYFRQLLDRYQGDYRHAATAYHAGYGRLNELLAENYPLRYDYYNRIMRKIDTQTQHGG